MTAADAGTGCIARGRDRPILVLIAEDEKPLREALVALIEGQADLEIVGAVADADAAIETAMRAAPDVILQDVRIPRGGGSRVAQAVTEQGNGTNVIALSAYEDGASVLAMLRAGAIGYLVKGTSPPEILEAVRRAARGQASLSGQIVAGVVEDLVREIESRRETERSSRQSEQLFRALLDEAPDATIVIDERGAIVFANRQTMNFFGYDPGELVGSTIDVLLPERFHAEHRQRLAGYFTDGRSRPMGSGLELFGRRKNGTEFPIDIALSAIETVEGAFATAFIRDISTRREAEDAIRHSEERLAQLIEAAPDAVVIIDAAGRIELTNRQTEDMFGYGRDQLIGQRVELLLPERFRHAHVGHRAGYFADPRTRPMGVGLLLAGLRRDGTEFPIDISLSAIDTDDGRLATAHIRDITDRNLQAALEQSLEERRALLSHLVSAGEEERQRIAVDIHDDSIQVMAAAGMRLQILRGTLEDPTQLELLDSLAETVELSIARLRHLLFELHPPVLDREGLSAALRTSLDEAERQTSVRHILDDRLISQPSQDTRLIIYRIVQEALANIRKHAHAAIARVLLDHQAGGYLVRVSDDGRGFDADSFAGSAPGHLGLTAIRERAELAGGWLRIRSEAGSGTSVEFWIPTLGEEAAL